MVANDLTIYSEYANEWWTPGAARFRSLQNLTPFRLELIEEWCGRLDNRTIVDLGCGGGLLSLPLLERGALVTGIDLSEPSVTAARQEAQRRGLKNFEFFSGDIRATTLAPNSADIVLLADVLDHIPDYALALKEAARVVKTGGLVFVGTINRSPLSRILTIWVAETLRLIPPGTHKYQLFIRPSELIATAAACNLRCQQIQGETVSLWPTLSRWAITLRRSPGTALAYSVLFQKGVAP